VIPAAGAKWEGEDQVRRRNSKGGKGFVSIPTSFCKCISSLEPISRSEIPLRALLPCALCVKKSPQAKNHISSAFQGSKVGGRRAKGGNGFVSIPTSFCKRSSGLSKVRRRNSKGGKGFVSIPPSFCKCISGLEPISRSEIPLRALLPCALCVKKESSEARKDHFPSSPSAFPRVLLLYFQ
jgi:hypothetical protein